MDGRQELMELRRLEELESRALPQNGGQAAPTGVGLTPAQEYQNEHPFIRTLGRGGRAVAGGLSSVADLALLAPKTAAIGAGMVAENLGARKAGQALQKVGMLPTMADTSKAIIDDTTGNVLKHTGFWDKAGDFAGEMIAASVPFARADDAINLVRNPGVKDAVSSALNPQKTADGVFLKKYSTPEKITSDQIRKKAGTLYKTAEQKGGVLTPDFTNKFVDDVEKLKPQTDIGQIVGGDSTFTKVVDKISSIRDRPITLEAAQELDEFLGDAMEGFMDMGKLTKQGKKLFDVQSTLRNMIEEADEALILGGREGFDALKQGRKLWATSRKLADVERIIKNSENYQVPATAIKTGFRTLLKNPNRLKGFSDIERKAVERAAKTGVLTDVLSVFGSRLGPIGSSVAGTAAAGPIGGVVSGLGSYALSGASRAGASAIQKNKAQAVADLIAGGSKASQPLLTNQGSAAAISATNALGQKLLPAPSQLDPKAAALAKILREGQQNGL